MLDEFLTWLKRFREFALVWLAYYTLSGLNSFFLWKSALKRLIRDYATLSKLLLCCNSVNLSDQQV
jgi:hypothetical protein